MPTPHLSPASIGGAQTTPRVADYLAVETALRAEWDRVLETAILDCGVKNIREANAGLEAFIQWFLAISACQPNQRLVMLKGPVDKMWHALILNTELYRGMCSHRFGFFLDHKPQPGYPPAGSIRQTVAILVQEYGRDLSNLLVAWSPTTVCAMMPMQLSRQTIGLGPEGFSVAPDAL